MKLPKLNQQGIVHLLPLFLLVGGLVAAVYLVQQTQIFKPRASVSGPVGGITYVDTKIGCSNPQGLTPDQICQQKGFPQAVAVDGTTAAKGYWWRQCGGASVSNCDRLDCTVNQLDCTNTAGYWGSQQPYPENYTRAGTTSTSYRPDELGVACAGYSPGWTMRVACSLGGSVSGPVSPSPSPSLSPVPGFGRALHIENITTSDGWPTPLQLVILPSGRSTTELGNEFTIEFWVKYRDIPAGRLRHRTQNLLRIPRILHIQDTDSDQRLRIFVGDAPNWDVFTGPSLAPNNWHHVALTYSNSRGSLVLYMDGKYEIFNTSRFRDDNSMVREFSQIYYGEIDELRISNIARYPYDPNSSSYPVPYAPFRPDANTLMLLHFDGNAADSSGNGNDGQLNGERGTFIDSTVPTSPPTPTTCTINDLRAAFFSRRGEPKYNQACDINNDGRISVTDYSALLRRR